MTRNGNDKSYQLITLTKTNRRGGAKYTTNVYFTRTYRVEVMIISSITFYLMILEPT